QSWNFADSGYQTEGHEEEYDATAEQAPAETDTVSVEQTVPAPIEAPTDDDSIEAYMSRLLQRVQGDEPEAEDETTPAGTDSIPIASETIQTVAETATGPESERAETPIIPRSQAPEREHNMSAMRELANQSARNAVARSIRLQARNTQASAALKAIAGISFLLLPIILGEIMGLSFMLKMIAWGAGFVASAIFLNEAYGLWSDSRRRLSMAEQSADGIGDLEEASDEQDADSTPVGTDES
ncbi:MAG: hypothetical protein AAFU85_13805, partial [Planctomycetota bacterium]